MRNYAIAFLLFVLFVNCRQTASVSNELIFDKLIGVWEIENEQAYERWSKNPDGTYTSVMFTYQAADTNFSEKVKVYKAQNNWIFETLVKGQNGGQPVKFTSTQLSNTEVTFENQAHDFPKIIHYSIESATLLRAFIAGGTDTVRFNFARAQ
jgi:hypothetical protein